MLTLTYTQRIPYCSSLLAKRLLSLLDEKKTNLALSADVTTAKQLLTLAEQLGPEICVLKTHMDIISDFTPTLIHQLMQLAQQHRFLLFEDRKFADIGHTVKHQYTGGLYHIADWADIINAHSLPGPGMIQGLAEGNKKQSGLLLIAEMSAAGHLMSAHYANQTLGLAEQFPDFAFGFISQQRLSPYPGWLYFTPGIQSDCDSDSLGQQYISPKQALEQGSDIIIVGRGIVAATHPLAAAQRYRAQGWQAYESRCQCINKPHQ
jgi:uridine monophosphate synthetase